MPKTMNMAQNEPKTTSQARRPPSGKSSSSLLHSLARSPAASSASIVPENAGEGVLPFSLKLDDSLLLTAAGPSFSLHNEGTDCEPSWPRFSFFAKVVE